MGARVAVVGASGYTGAELLRIALGHPELEPVLATSREFAGRPVRSVYPNLPTDLAFAAFDLEEAAACDLVFLALPHGAAAETAAALHHRGTKVVDLSADLRFDDPAAYPEWFGAEHPAPGLLPGSVYGLPELHRASLRNATLVANPGCYPTATILAIAPFLAAGLVDPATIVVTAASGVSGAGRGVNAGVHFSHVDSNFKPYGAPRHKHTPEIEQELGKIAGAPVTITFVPHLVPMPRGLLATVTATMTGPADPAALLQERWADEPFVVPTEGFPETKYTAGSNLALVHAVRDDRTARLIATCAIDNLGKGAAGQAIQNANLVLGFGETVGLGAGGLYP